MAFDNYIHDVYCNLVENAALIIPERGNNYSGGKLSKLLQKKVTLPHIYVKRLGEST